MYTKLNPVLSLFAMFLMAVCGFTASAQETSLVGSWQTTDPELTLRVTFNADGTGLLDIAPIKYSVRGDKLMINDDGVMNNYTFKLSGDVLVVSGGNLKSPLSFVRQNNEKGFGKPRTDPAGEQKEVKPKEQGIVGRWQSSKDTVQINEDGTLSLNGETYRYTVKGNNITLANNEGALTFPFKLSGDTLQVLADGRLDTYKRLTGVAATENVASASSSNPRELAGKWCYMSNVNSSGGGRTSNRCFTLYENGAYDYYSATNSSGAIASSASLESDSGTWKVSGETLIANSRARGPLTFSLEKRNHPKTGDPMLLLDGDAFVTYSPRSPWR